MLSEYLPNKLPDEQIIKVMHRDLFILFKRIFFFLFVTALIGGAANLLLSVFPDMVVQDFFPAIALVGAAFGLFVWLFFFFSVIDYYLDVWIVTNERIINVSQEGFFARTISEQRLFRVQDVTSEVKGLVQTIFRYGTVYVQTAAEKERFAFEEIPDADGVRELIMKLAEANSKKHEAENL
jgi:membrane protein YdbS with pleckstrin-like domain